jgi:DNA-binding transcriptional LysR family regulator
MTRSSVHGRAYKELTFQQLRSFNETARLGSLAAAAKSLGMSHPTVREQVLALQREFNVQLIEPHGRGSRLTPEGRLLAEMAAPIVTSVAALRRRFDMARQNSEVRLVIAATPRFFLEDLPTAVQSWLRNRPKVRLGFLELRDDQVLATVASGAADFGLTGDRIPNPLPPGIGVEHGYELETLLITSLKHPLAKQRAVRPADLKRYPVLSSRHSLADLPDSAARFDREGIFGGPAPCVEPFLATTLRRYVELNLGIALVMGLPQKRSKQALHERSMSRYFGRGIVHFAFRLGGSTEEHARSFAETIRKCNLTRLKEG